MCIYIYKEIIRHANWTTALNLWPLVLQGNCHSEQISATSKQPVLAPCSLDECQPRCVVCVHTHACVQMHLSVCCMWICQQHVCCVCNVEKKWKCRGQEERGKRCKKVRDIVFTQVWSHGLQWLIHFQSVNFGFKITNVLQTTICIQSESEHHQEMENRFIFLANICQWNLTMAQDSFIGQHGRKLLGKWTFNWSGQL